MVSNLRSAGLTLCVLVATSLPIKETSASTGYASLNGVLKEYTVKKREKLQDVIKKLYQRTAVCDAQGHLRGSYPTHLEDMERYQAIIPWMNRIDLSTEVQPGQKLVLPYGGSLVCSE